MASATNNNDAPPTRSHFHKTVTLQNWWLTKPQSDGKTLGVAGLTCSQNRAGRWFYSAPILKTHVFFELETVDGVFIILQGYINKERTLENGFSPDVLDEFVIGFPYNWKEFSTICPEVGSAAESDPIAQDDKKDSNEGLADFNDNLQNHCDSYTVGIEARDSEDTILSNKTCTVPKASSLETPCEHLVKDGNAVVCENLGEFDGPSLKMSPIIQNDVDPSTQPKRFGLCSRRVTRSMAKSVGCKKSIKFVPDLDEVTPNDPKKLKRGILDMDNSDALSNKKDDNVVSFNTPKKRKANTKLSGGRGKRSKQKQNDHNVDVTEDINIASSVIDVNDELVLMRSQMKACKTKQKEVKFSSGVDVQNKEDVDATNIINSKNAIATQSKMRSSRSRSKISKKQPIRSAKSTSRPSKGTKEGYGTPNILPIESISGKKSRSGRVILPALEYWRNQQLVYDEDRQVCGVQEPM